ncbi:hypothetical protein PHJA_002261700 [Phtheirospermum japonicum]|uniref:KIB1-4 beta-propeller domain-containing protein n=1 Tax=Phtheirospermum japonicum TaxID=374723 RepID=A0A830CKI9_9LAMI|nr:hypothetical protein PHJA_002261700 [Phtheirospermum japonicum]
MVLVEGDILGVFVTSPSGKQVRVEKLDFNEMRWSKVESLGNKILHLSRGGSFAEICVDSNEEANKIYFNQLYNRTIGVAYSLNSGMYHSADGNFASDGSCGLTILPGATWIKPT